MTIRRRSFDLPAPLVDRMSSAVAALRTWAAKLPRPYTILGSVAAVTEREAASGDESPPYAGPAAAARDPLQQWHEVALRTLVAVGIFSVFVNLLMLTMPIYLFQISDRVLTSRSMDTLVMLSLLALGFILVLSLLDTLRRQVLGRLATKMETILGGPVIASVVTSAPASDGGNMLPLRSLHQVRGFMSSPTMVILFDAPMAPLYFAAVFLIHPSLGFVTLAAGGVLLAIAFINQRATSAPLGQANMYASKADAQADALARNAQVINAMGMLNESILQWGREQTGALTKQMTALDLSFWISGTSRFFRLFTQIAILGWGAYLALDNQLTGGMMIAASIIAGRALQPLEGMIEGWRSVVQTHVAYGRVKAAVAGPAKGKTAAASAQAAGPCDGGKDSVSATRHERTRSERRQLRVETRRDAGDRWAVRVRQIHACAHPRGLPAAHRRQGSPRWHRAAQLGPAPVRRIHRLSSPGGRAVSGVDQGQCLPHAPRPSRRHDLQRRRDLGRA